MSPTILLTGATRGLGKATAIRFAQAGATVVMVARDADRGTVTAAEILSLSPHAEVDLMVGDLSSMADVRRLATEVSIRHPRLSVLLNIAGVSKFTREETADGLETTFATNHLAPFLLSNLLLDVLAVNAPANIVTISSEQHRWVRGILWDDLQSERKFRPIEVYSLTKLYNVLFTRELARRAAERGVAVNCMSPGFLRTDLGREATGSFRLFLKLARPFQKSPELAAEAVVGVAGSELQGRYFRGSIPAEPSALARDESAAVRLWDITADLAALPKKASFSGPPRA